MWQLDILRTATATAKPAAQMVADNRRLMEHVRGIGGYSYPVGSTPLTRRAWEQHYGDASRRRRR